MCRPDLFYKDVEKLTERYWPRIVDLEKKLAEAEKAYQDAARRPPSGSGSNGRSSAPSYYKEMAGLSDTINNLYTEWQRNLTYIKPPDCGTKKSGSIASKIPWPSQVPMGVRRQLTRVIEQGGIPISKRVQIVPTNGGKGVALEFSKW